MPEVSIIVPVYNAEKGIRRCIESVLDQEFSDFELILVDDGSKDASPAILDEYAAKDPRVIVIHKQNEGVSATRNLGIEKAQGTYIQFMDADDWLTEDSTKTLVRAAKADSCDLVTAGFYRVVSDRVARKSSVDDECLLTLKQYAENMMENPADYYYGVLWNKLYRRDLIMQYQLRMDENLSFCEDFIFNLEYLIHCNTIKALNIPVYYYVKTEGSLVARNLNPTRIVQMKLNVFTYYNNFFRDILDEKEYRSDRMSISRFLIAAANDDMVIPMMPGTRRLGEEKVTVPYHGESGNPLLAGYYLRKLYEKYLNIFAMKYDITLRDAWVLSAIAFSRNIRYTKSISDFTGISELMVTATIEKLLLKKLITQTYIEEESLPVFAVAEEQVRKDLDETVADMSAAALKGISMEETEMLRQLIDRVGRNIKNMTEAN